MPVFLRQPAIILVHCAYEMVFLNQLMRLERFLWDFLELSFGNLSFAKSPRKMMAAMKSN